MMQEYGVKEGIPLGGPKFTSFKLPYSKTDSLDPATSVPSDGSHKLPMLAQFATIHLYESIPHYPITLFILRRFTP